MRNKLAVKNFESFMLILQVIVDSVFVTNSD